MKKIVIASDSFKGCASSLEVAEAAAAAVRRVFPDCEVVKIPVADGGEGTMEALLYSLNGRMVSCTVHDPLMNPIRAEYGISDDSKTAIIEMAAASGLPLVPEDKRDPLQTTTYGTGELIKDALARGCRQFLIGIGGSATNDAGTGMLQALGFRFLNSAGQELGRGGKILTDIHTIDDTNAISQLCESVFTIACDVNNPFSGKDGAAYVYARQKGANDASIRLLDEGLSSFASIVEKEKHINLNTIAGAGAAGGLGGGFLAFLPATLKPGIRMVLDAIRFEEQIRGADLIITGEGKLDVQTAMGKTPWGVLQVARGQNIPVIAIGGSVENTEALNNQGFLSVFSIQPGVVTLEQAMEKKFALANIERTVIQFLRIVRRTRDV